MRRALLLLFPALLFGQTPPVVQDRDKASLEGQALNSATGEPIRKVRVTLKMNVAPPQTTRQQQPPPTAPPPPSVTVVTDTAGKFLFPNLEPGDYQLLARRDGFANAQLGRDGKKRDPILLAKGDSKTGLIVKMIPYGAIAGRLTDEDGDPIRGINVGLVTYQYTTRGRELVDSNNTATTDDLGEYRVFDIPPGKYFLKAGASQRQARMSRGADNEETFMPLFFPGSPDAASATPIELAAGQQLRGLNLILRRARLATLRGRVIGPGGANFEVGLMVTDDSGSSSSSGNTDDKEGRFELHGVLPGRVFVIGGYSLEGRRYRTYLPLQVGSSDINGLELRPIPPMQVTGQVRIEGETTVKLTDLQISMQGPERSTSVGPKENGALIFPELEPFAYRVLPTRMQSLYLKSVYWGTADVTDGEIDLTNGVPPRTELAVVLGADSGQIEGTVKNDRSEPADAAMITLVPVGARRTRSFFKTASSDALGHFSIRGIAPGSYKIFAWDKVDPNAVMYDPEFLRPYAGAGESIEVLPHDKTKVEVKLTLNQQSQ